MFTQQAAQNVAVQIADAVKAGAQLLVGEASGKASGDFKTIIKPTVLADIKPSMPIAIRETFGPVIALIPFDTMDEAIAIANDSAYSLIASLWTSNLHEAMTYAPRIRAGSVQVNGATVHVGFKPCVSDGFADAFAHFRSSRHLGMQGLVEQADIHASTSTRSRI